MQTVTETEKVRHLLRRFGLGASEAEVDFYGAGGYLSAVEKLLASDQHEEAVTFGEEFLYNKDGKVNGNPKFAQAVWYSEQLVTNRPLTYKMALFWHDHFATSMQKVSNGPIMLNHIRLLRDKGLGNFRDFLLEISKDPAMLYWLDNESNVRGKPNENFAREVMELFTLGEGNYTENDIQEAARCFTGWTYGIRRGNRLQVARNQVPPMQSEFVFDEKSHDPGTKTVFGNAGEWMGEDIVGILCGNPRTAYYITEKIWNWFVEPKPKKATIEKFAEGFRKGSLNIRELIRSIMLSEEFQSEQVRRVVIKNPYDFCIPMARQLGVGSVVVEAATKSDDYQQKQRALQISQGLKQSMLNMGMELMQPPDVSGWPSYSEWISTSTIVERISFGKELFVRNGRSVINANGFIGSGQPSDVVDRLVSLFDVNLSSVKRQELVKSATKNSGGQVTSRNVNVVCGEVMQLLCSTPEFQFM
ncbi:MAG: DUF1800 family protein [Fimbriimonadaceae bacterium]